MLCTSYNPDRAMALNSLTTKQTSLNLQLTYINIKKNNNKLQFEKSFRFKLMEKDIKRLMNWLLKNPYESG